MMKRGIGIKANSVSKPSRQASPTRFPPLRQSAAPKSARLNSNSKILRKPLSTQQRAALVKSAKPAALKPRSRPANKTPQKLTQRKSFLQTQAYKQRLAKKGEMAAKRSLRKEGFNRFPSLKHNQIHGIDIGAMKLSKQGKILKAAVIESKASRNKNLGLSSFRNQTSHRYVLRNLLKAKKMGIKHADRLYEMAKARKLSIYGTAYNKQSGRVKLHRVFEPHVPNRSQQKSATTNRRR